MHPRPKEGETSPNIVQFGAGNEVLATGNDEAAAGMRLAIHEHELLRRIGRGAYGEVWLARNALGTYRAVKVVYRKDFEDNRPFEREFEGIQKFEPISRSHEGLVNILQVGRHEDYFYYVMELADDASAECGVRSAECKERVVERASALTPQSASRIPQSYVPHTLREDLRNHGRLPAERCVQIGLALTSALAHLHKHGLVHRDIKPSNIILVRGAPKLADIGLVTDAGDSQSIVGTEGYLPPEGPGTPQADIFSLGKVLYELSTGQDRRNFPDLPPNLREWPDHEAVLELNEVVLKACAQRSESRYATAEATRTDLEILQQGKSVKHERALQQLWSTGKKAGLGALLVLMVLAVSLFISHRLSDGYAHSSVPGVDELVEQGDSIARGMSPERVQQALIYFKEAIALDPTSVPAHFSVFRAQIFRGAANWDAPAEVRRELRAAAAKLVLLAPSSAEARAASSMIEWIDWRFREALADARLATRIRPGSKDVRAAALTYYGFFLLESGKPDEALHQYQLAEKLRPAGSIIQYHLGHPYFAKRDFEQALKHYQKSVELEGRHQNGHYWKGRVYEEIGNFVDAIREFEECDRAGERYTAATKVFYDSLREAVRQDGGQGYWSNRLAVALGKPQQNPYQIATLYAHLGDKNNAYAWLAKACDQKAFTEGLMFDLCWDHNDEQFKVMAKGIGLLQ